MNTINIAIDFTNGTNKITGISLITGDYASTKIVFTFDRTDGTKIFEMKNPSGQIVYAGEIENNEVVLSGVDNGENYSIFNEAGFYIYEVSLYVGDTKLTSAKGQLPVKKEQVVVGDETIEPYLPIFDELMQEINTAITETNNLNIEAEKVDTTTTITITHKNGTEQQVQILDGEKGDKGDKGEPGAIKLEIVAELPETGQDDTIYLVPITPDTSGNNYAEYIYINNAWELLGKIGVQVDLTGYYTKQETDTLLNGKQNTIDSNHKLDYSLISNTPNLSVYELLSNKVTSISSSSTDTQYPSAKCVYDLVGDIATAIDLLNGEII